MIVKLVTGTFLQKEEVKTAQHDGLYSIFLTLFLAGIRQSAKGWQQGSVVPTPLRL